MFMVMVGWRFGRVEGRCGRGGRILWGIVQSR